MRKININLIEACLRKERIAQKQLYTILLPYMKSIACRYLRNNQYVMDVLQESFVKIFMDIEQYDSAKGDIKSWASRIVINKSINYNNRIISIHTQDIEDVDLQAEDTENNQLPEDKKTLERILTKIPKGYFEVFNLFVIDGYDHEEIGGILNITPALSRKKLSRARAWIREKNIIKQVMVFIFLLISQW